MNYCHLLLTRFNVQYKTGDTRGISPEWLEERFRLFERYCLPSIQKQTCTDFAWIIVGDIRTPDTYKAKLEAYQRILPQIKVLWWPFNVSDDDYHVPFQQLGISFAKNCDVLITSRIDNDDAIPADYMEQVQQIAKSGGEGFISFPIGLQTFAKNNKSYIVRYEQNHFLSRIEKSGFYTVMAYDHSQINKRQLRLIETENPMWEEVVHGGNIHNDFEPKYRYIIRKWSDVPELACLWVVFVVKHLFRKLHIL